MNHHNTYEIIKKRFFFYFHVEWPYIVICLIRRVGLSNSFRTMFGQFLSQVRAIIVQTLQLPSYLFYGSFLLLLLFLLIQPWTRTKCASEFELFNDDPWKCGFQLEQLERKINLWCWIITKLTIISEKNAPNACKSLSKS